MVGPGDVVLRSTTGVVAVVLAACLVAVLVGQALLLGRADTVLAAGPWLLAGLWVMVAVLARPRVVLGRRAAEVVGVLRRHTLPWGAVADAVLAPQVRFRLRDGRTVTAWDSSRRRDDAALRALVDARIAAHEDGGGLPPGGERPLPRSRWDVPVLAVGAGAALLCAASVLSAAR